MIIRNYKLRSHQGFTLIEILVGMALTAILITGIVVTIFQVNTGTAQTKNSMYALRQVQTVGYYISRDALQADSINVTGNTSFPVTLTWTDPDPVTGREYNIKYEYDETTRYIYREDLDDGTVIRIAENIEPTPSFSTNGSGYYILTITANVSGYQPASETRTYEIDPRIAGN
jgi:prepilin-type N-terminal cleavage/methylation domain-containing protein